MQERVQELEQEMEEEKQKAVSDKLFFTHALRNSVTQACISHQLTSVGL